MARIPWALPVTICVLCAVLFPATPPPRSLYLEQGGIVWCGNENGLFQYQADEELWSVVRPEPVTDICLDDNTLWIGTRQGILYAETRYMNWKAFDAGQGLAIDSVARIVADLDYVYAAGRGGVFRMDKLVEQWQPIGDFKGWAVRDLLSDQDNLWIASDRGVRRFLKQYDKWETWDVGSGLPSDNVFSLFRFRNDVWAVTDRGLARYNDGMKVWTAYGLKDGLPDTLLTRVTVDPGHVWVVTEKGIARFNGESGSWEDFSANTPLSGAVVRDVSVTGTSGYFVTGDGVYAYQEDKRLWTLHTRADGLISSDQREVFASGRNVLCRSGSWFSVYRPAENQWFSRDMGRRGGATGSGYDFYSDARGTGVRAPGGESLNLLGRAYFKMRNRADFNAPLFDNVREYVTAERPGDDPDFNHFMYWWTKAALNMNGNLRDGRNLFASYDNTDPRGDLRYGAEYRGNPDDALRSAGWLETQKTDYFFSTLVDPTVIEGAGARAQFGERVGAKKRSRVNAGVWGGYRKTAYLRKLVPFDKGNFYFLGVSNIVTESVELTVNGDPVDPADYSIERTMGILSFRDEALVNPESRIEIACEYEPSLTGHTEEVVSGENMVAVNDHVAVGATGLYRQHDVLDGPGTGMAKAKAWTGDLASEVEFKSTDGRRLFRAYPEISGSFNDSVLVEKQGNAGRLRMNAVVDDLRVEAQARTVSDNYESQTDLGTACGRVRHDGSAEAVYDITPFMPLSAGGSLLRAERGAEERAYAEYLVSLKSLPSLKVRAAREDRETRTEFSDQDSIRTRKLTGRVETVWDAPEAVLKAAHVNRITTQAAYNLDLVSDSLFEGAGEDYVAGRNHNGFALLRLYPDRKLMLETKGAFRYAERRFDDREAWERGGTTARPEFTLFSQELLPGLTLYGKLKLEETYAYASRDTAAEFKENRFNGNVLVVPGVYWAPLSPLQANLGYNRAGADSTLAAGGERAVLVRSSAETYSAAPALYLGQDIRFLNRSEWSNQSRFGRLSGRGIKVYNDLDLYFRGRKTNFLTEYDYFRDSSSLAESLPFTRTSQHQLRGRWTERWRPSFRTELKLGLARQYADTLSGGYADALSPSLLLDFRSDRFVREFRVQERTGPSFFNGQGLDFGSYSAAWENRLDISVKAGRNLVSRLLVNLNYLFEERRLRYDMAEFKLTALF